MSLFERLKSAVKGNPVLREYDLGQQIASAGPGLFWRVYQGVKKTTRKDVAVFIFDKKSKEFDKLNKRNRDLLLEIFKSGPLQLSRLRHPRLLTVDHPLEESNDILAFTTEPISACLANVLGDHSNFQSAVPTEVKDIQLSPLEVKYGLLHVVEAISFLHADAKLVHGNLNPNCIFLDSVGRWKVGGFEFYHSLVNSQEMEVKEWSTKQPAFSQPLLNFTAPEYIITKLVSRCSDMFSYAMLAFVAYNGGRVLYDHRNNLSQYSKNIEWVSRIPLQSLDGVPDELKENVKAMLCIEPAVRPQACDLAKSSFFTEDPQVSTLMYLDNLYEKPELEKSQFFKVLPKIVSAYPKRILLSFVLPPLKVEFMDKRMIPFLLPTIFLIAEGLSSQEFALHILPLLVPVFKMQEPVQIQLILLQRMDLLLQKTSAREIREHIVPLIHTSLQSSSSKVQELCIGLLPEFAEMLDFTSLNKYIVGQLLSLLNATESLSLQVKILVSLSKLLDVLDKDVVLHQILPRLPTVESKQPAVLMSILGVYHAVMRGKKFSVDRHYLAGSVLPHLLSLSLQTTLKTSQFEQFSRLIHEILTKVENEQRSYLEQMGKMQEQTISTVELAQEMKENKGNSSTSESLPGSLPFGAKDILSTVKPMEPVNQTSEPVIVTPSIVAGQLPTQPRTSSLVQGPSTGMRSLADEEGESSSLLGGGYVPAHQSRQSQPTVTQNSSSELPHRQTRSQVSVPVSSVFGTAHVSAHELHAPKMELGTSQLHALQPEHSKAQTLQQAQMRQPSQPQPQMLQPSQPQPQMLQPSQPQPQMLQPSQPQPQMLQPSQPQPQMLQPSQPQSQMLQPSQPQPQMLQPSQPQPQMLQPSQPQPQMLQPSQPQPQMLQPSQPQPQMLQPSQPQPQMLQPTQPLFSGMSVTGDSRNHTVGGLHPPPQQAPFSSSSNVASYPAVASSNQQAMPMQSSMFDNMFVQPSNTPPSSLQPAQASFTPQHGSLAQSMFTSQQAPTSAGSQNVHLGVDARRGNYQSNSAQVGLTSLSVQDMDDLLS